jgi:hypothetical protein
VKLLFCALAGLALLPLLAYGGARLVAGAFMARYFGAR